MIEKWIDIETADGSMPTFIVHPEDNGPYPVVLYLMDAPGIRSSLRDMASRLATVGYYVMLPYLYYRGGALREFTRSAQDIGARRELMKTVTASGIRVDGDALLKAAGWDEVARDGKVGIVGFCMSGPLMLSLAKHLPDVVAAGASVHGAGLVGQGDDSPHRNLNGIAAELYFAWADQDQTAPAGDIPILERALSEAGVRYHIDFMTGALHGFAPPGEESYDRGASERHWERVFGLLRRAL